MVWPQSSVPSRHRMRGCGGKGGGFDRARSARRARPSCRGGGWGWGSPVGDVTHSTQEDAHVHWTLARGSGGRRNARARSGGGAGSGDDHGTGGELVDSAAAVGGPGFGGRNHARDTDEPAGALCVTECTV